MRLRTGLLSAITATAFVVVFMALFGTWYTVDAGERGVLTTNGAYDSTSDPGLHFKMPFVQDVTFVSIQQQTTRWDCGEQGACMQSYSRDQQPADLRVSVLWHALPDRMEQIYTQYGGSLDNVMIRLIAPKTSQAVKTVFGQFTAVSAVQERARFNAAVNAAVAEAIDESAPVIIDGVQVENIDYSAGYEQSIEARMLAEVEVQKRQQELAQQKIAAEITVTNAQAAADSQLAQSKMQAETTRMQGDAEAYSRLAKAKSEAESRRLLGAAEAEAIKVRGDALRENPTLIALTQAERWNGQLPTTMLPTGAVPMLNLGGQP